jgi:hypothetical protein
MLTLIAFIIVGLIIASLTQYNSMLVSLNIGGYIFSNVPLFYVVLGSLLAGLVLGYFFQLIDSVFTTAAIVRKDRKLEKAEKEAAELRAKLAMLEREKENSQVEA